MLKTDVTAVVQGCGEIGSAIYQLCRGVYEQVIIEDPKFGAPDPAAHPVEVLHVALPGTLEGFVQIVVACVRKYRPDLVVINSTTPLGYTDAVAGVVGADRVVHAQVHGKHRGNRMRSDMLYHPRFVGTTSDVAFAKAKRVFMAMGHPEDRILRLSSARAGELVKLLATSFFGYLVAWAQEVERLAAASGVEYEELMSFSRLDTPDFDIHGKYPGVIGGHCVMPNLEILRAAYPSPIWDFIAESNRRKAEGGPASTR